MLAKRIICMLSAGAMFAAAVPAFADHNYRDGYRAYQRAVPARVYHGYGAPAYRHAPVYAHGYGYGQPAYGAPAYGYGYGPGYQDRDNAIATVGGAALGAFIGSQVGYGPNQGAAIAAGAIIGGLIGSNF